MSTAGLLNGGALKQVSVCQFHEGCVLLGPQLGWWSCPCPLEPTLGTHTLTFGPLYK